MEIVFLLAADGPTNYESFRPNLDNQWWSRRDALVRCVAQSLYAYPSGIMSCNIFFSEDMSILTMKNSMKSSLTIPNEKELISMWRMAAAGAKNCPDSIAFSRDLWKQGSVQKSISLGEMPSDDDLEKLDKRQLLEMIQKRASLDFLREHKLNSSPAVVLKKTNAVNLKSILKLCFATLTNSDDRHKKDTESADPLYLTFRAFLKNVQATHVLTLHEDAYWELPLFSNKLQEVNSDVNTINKKKVIVCCLGAVRDLKKTEEKFLFEAASALNLPCLSANLGRTAEFTSKIISVLSAAAFSKRLEIAVSALESKIETFKEANGSQLELFKKQKPIRGWTWDGCSSSMHTVDLHDENTCQLENLDDNQKVNGFKRPLDWNDDYLEVNSMPRRRKKIVNQALDYEPNFDDEEANYKDNFEVNSPPPLHVFMPLPLSKVEFCDILSSGSSAEQYVFISLAVCVLWRSKLAKEKNSDKGIPSSNECSLTFHFSDFTFARVNQNRLVQALASRHEAAPSEAQLLKGLIECVNESYKDGKDKSMKSLIKKQRKIVQDEETLVVELTDSNLDNSLSIVDFFSAYYSKSDCWCASVSTASQRSENNSNLLESAKQIILLISMNTRKTEKNIKDAILINGQILGVAGCGAIVCWLQQLGYHGMLRK